MVTVSVWGREVKLPESLYSQQGAEKYKDNTYPTQGGLAVTFWIRIVTSNRRITKRPFLGNVLVNAPTKIEELWKAVFS
jgi:hypothetical protein